MADTRQSLALMLAGAQLCGGDPWDVVRAAQEARGIASRTVNAGAVTLADWLIATVPDVDGGGTGHRLRRLRDDEIVRLLTGEIEPTDAVALYVAEVTGGAVLPEAWSTPWTVPWGVTPPASPPPPAAVAATAEEDALFVTLVHWRGALTRDQADRMHAQLRGHLADTGDAVLLAAGAAC